MKRSTIFLGIAVSVTIGVVLAWFRNLSTPSLKSNDDKKNEVLQTSLTEQASNQIVVFVGEKGIDSKLVRWEMATHTNAPQLTDPEAFSIQHASGLNTKINNFIESPAKDLVTEELQKRILVSLVERKILYQWITEFSESFDHQNPIRFTECVEKARTYADSDISMFKDEFGKEAIKQKLCEQSLIEQYARERIYTAVTITDEELQKYIKGHKNSFSEPQKLIFLQILLAKEEEAKSVKAKINANNFRELAKKHSIAAEGPLGGRVGPFSRDQLPVLFEPVFKMPIGEISDIIRSDYGFHIVMPIERIPPRDLQGQELKMKARGLLKTDKELALYQEWLNKALNAITIRKPEP